MSQDHPAPAPDADNAKHAVAEPVRPPAARPSQSPPKRDSLPPFKVLLHNDDVNDFEYVIRAVVQVAGLATQAAIRVTFEADKAGVSLVTVTHKERAELLVEQFQSKGITSTMEPAEA